MSYLDSDAVQVFRESAGTDADGNPVRTAGTVPVTVYGSMQPLSAEESALYGQTVATTAKLFASRFPAGACSRVRWAGRDWDVVGEPQRRPGGLAGHTTVILRARSPEPL